MNTSFPHDYEVEQLTEGPGTSASCHYYYPNATTNGGHDGILVRIRPNNGNPWFATFAFGEIGPKSPSGIFTTPDSQRLLVVAKGAGYFVSVNDPSSWEPVRVTPIIDVRPILNHEIIVFADFTRLVAYGKSGVKWATKRLSWDNLKINDVTDSVIKGEFWDIRSDATESFIVDLETGRSDGGVEESEDCGDITLTSGS